MTKLLLKNSSTNMSTFTTIIFPAITLFTLYHTSEAATCKKMSLHPPAQKPKVVLVHGFTGGGWCWFKVKYILESFGYNVTALDLKASGIDQTNISKIGTFEQYNEPLNRFMASLPRHEKIVLMGHSAGGVSLTKALHDHSESILVAIYVAATMLKSGYLTCQDLQMGVPHFHESKCNAGCPTLPKPTCFEEVLQPPRQLPIAIQTEDLTLGKSLARPGPYRAVLTSNFTEAAKKSAGAADKVPRVYVKTRFDQTLQPEQQAAMIKRWPPCEVIEINNDHDVPSARPELLASLIINATLYPSVR